MQPREFKAATAGIGLNISRKIADTNTASGRSQLSVERRRYRDCISSLGTLGPMRPIAKFCFCAGRNRYGIAILRKRDRMVAKKCFFV
jgi:hypothetical protein